MHKVKNRKVIRRLADKSFQNSRTRNIIAVLAIALTTTLFTTLFTIGMGAIESFQLSTMRQSGGDSHGVIKNLTRKQYNKLKEHPLIKESAPCILTADYVRNPEFLKRHLESWYIPAYHYEHCFIQILKGKAPELADEILLDETSMDLLGLKAEPGQKVTFQFQLKQSSPDIIKRTFTVSGIIHSDPALNVGFAIVSDAYLKEYAHELVYTYDQDYSSTGAIRMDVNFSNSFGIQRKLNKVIEDCGYSTEEEQEYFIASNANWAYISDGAESDSVTMTALAAGLLLIFLTGYLIIYNVFQISVIKDIRYYGLLKTVGTTGRQLKMVLRRQALLLSVLGIPLGILAGFFIGKQIVPHVIAITIFQESAPVTFHPVILAGAAAFTLLTVLISIGKPSRMAAKVSPVEAVRYTDNTKSCVKKASLTKRTTGSRIHRMALANLGRNKSRTAVVILSLSLAVVLLNSVFTITNAFDIHVYLKKFATFDFLIGNARYFGLDLYFGATDDTIDEENLSESFISACEAQDGFEKSGRIYCNTATALKADSYQPPKHMPRDENGNLYYIRNGQKVPLEEDKWGTYRGRTAFYGLEDLPLDAVEVWKGEKDMNVIREKLAGGNYLLSAVDTDDNNQVMEENIWHQPGDKVTLVLPDGTSREFEILSLIKTNYYGLTCRLGYEFVYYTTADIFKEMISEKYLMTCALSVEDGKEAEFERFIEDYTTTQEPVMSYESKLTHMNEFSKLSGLFILIGGVLTAIIGMVGILNFVNTILTGIVSRKKEFAMMEAIGMTRKQLSQMLILEGLFYAGITIAFSFILGILFSLTACRAVTGGMWFMKYHFVIWPMLAVFPVLLILGALIPYLVYLPQRRQSLISCLVEN